MSRFYEETRRKYPAFEVIGIEVQDSGEKVIKDHIDFYGMSYPIAAQGSFDGYTGYILPEVVLFDHKGEVILHKRLFDDVTRKAIMEALEDAPHPLLGDKEYVELADEAEWVKRNDGLGKVLAKVRRIWADENAEPKLWDEAYEMFSRLDNYAETLLARAETAAEENPVLGLRKYEEIRKRFEGDARGEEAAQAARILKESEHFARETAAWKLWEEEVLPMYKKHRFRITKKNRIMLGPMKRLCDEFENTAANDLAEILLPDLTEALKRAHPSGEDEK